MGHTNRGLRGFNCKLIVIKRPWWREALSTISFLFSYGLFSSSSGDSYQYVDQGLLRESEKESKNGGHHALPNIQEHDGSTGYEEDIAPGGDYVKLLLLPKPFSATFRQNWDTYRTEYWEKENERRQILTRKLKERERTIAKTEGGWFWWTGWHAWRRHKGHGERGGDIEKTHFHHRRGSLLEKDPKRIRSGSVRAGSHSRSSSRSSTPAVESEDGLMPGGHGRRGSTSDRKKKRGVQRLTSSGSISRSTTPDTLSPLAKQNSFTSVSSCDSERPTTPAASDVEAVKYTKAAQRPEAPSRKSSLSMAENSG